MKIFLLAAFTILVLSIYINSEMYLDEAPQNHYPSEVDNIKQSDISNKKEVKQKVSRPDIEKKRGIFNNKPEIVTSKLFIAESVFKVGEDKSLINEQISDKEMLENEEFILIDLKQTKAKYEDTIQLEEELMIYEKKSMVYEEGQISDEDMIENEKSILIDLEQTKVKDKDRIQLEKEPIVYEEIMTEISNPINVSQERLSYNDYALTDEELEINEQELLKNLPKGTK